MKDSILQEITEHDYLVCAWCAGVFDKDTMKRIRTLDKAELHSLPVSHGICPECKEKELSKLRRML